MNSAFTAVILEIHFMARVFKFNGCIPMIQISIFNRNNDLSAEKMYTYMRKSIDCPLIAVRTLRYSVKVPPAFGNFYLWGLACIHEGNG
jgi:hypothetical protein